jgi:selenium metabolism protein YedF
MKIIDTRGQKCPKPIIETKRALRECPTGETFKVLSDNKTSFTNISRFLNDNKIKYSVAEDNGVWTILITNETGYAIPASIAGNSSDVNRADSNADFAVVISSEFMGQGDDDLGSLLIKSFFISLNCLDETPSLIAFYNSGVKLVIKDSPIFNIIKELEEKGTEIIVCGTCVDHFNIGNRIGTGIVGDMYFITQKLSVAGKILRP